jgi:FkbM family methyltransferase
MRSLLHRALHFAMKLVAASHHFGAWGAFRVLCLMRGQTNDALTRVPLRSLGRDFHFRACSDRGVLCAFYEPNYRVLDLYGQRARVIIDAGANIGDSTARLLASHPQAQIIALDADAENHVVLELNFKDEPRVRTLHRALWSSDTTLQLEKTWANVASRVHPDAKPGSSAVPAVCVPTLMQEFGLDEIDILKLDIEGAEAEVFRTADTAWLRRVRCFIIECCDGDDPGTTTAIFSALELAGVEVDCHIASECLVLVRRDTPWPVVMDTWLATPPLVPTHLHASLTARGYERLD